MSVAIRMKRGGKPGEYSRVPGEEREYGGSIPSCKIEREAEAGPSRPNKRHWEAYSLTQAAQAEVQERRAPMSLGKQGGNQGVLPGGVLTRLKPCVMVPGWVVKEFSDRRQNKRRIEFIRVGDTVGTAGQLKGARQGIWVICLFL